MKRFITLLLLLVSIATTRAYDFMVDGLCYNINYYGYGVTVVPYNLSSPNQNYTHLSGNINIPAFVTYNDNTYPVTEIGWAAFKDCANITSVNIPNSIYRIGSQAFEWCNNLSSINIPNSVYIIDSDAFLGCYNLTAVNISDILAWCKIDFMNVYSNPLYYAENLYENGYKVTNIVFPNSYTKIKDYVLCNCSSLYSVTIPNSVKSIGDWSFRGCSNLTSLNLPNSVTSIGWASFAFCKSLPSIDFPNSVTSIGDAAFSNCSALTTINIPNSVTEIGSGAFSECTGLTALYLPNSVKNINDRTFEKCIELKYVSIPQSVTSIGYMAFYNCYSLSSIIIPNSVCSIDFDAFAGTQWYNSQPNGLVYAGMVAYKFKGTMPEGTTISLKEGCTGIASNAFFGCSGLRSVTIPNTATIIGSLAFGSCDDLTTLNIPNSVYSIGSAAFVGTQWFEYLPDGLAYAGMVAYKYKGTMPEATSITLKEGCTGIAGSAFNDCSGLTSISIPNTVKIINYYAFSGCSGLTSMIIPDSVTEIGDGAFEHCYHLTTVRIPSSINSIGNWAFEACGLEEFYCNIKEPINISSGVFDFIYLSNCTLYVPIGSGDAYHNANVWKEFGNIVEYDFSGIETIANDGVKIGVDGMNIIVKGIDNPQTAIYDLNGKTIYQGSQTIITIPQHGIYIIDINGKKSKILI